MPKRKQHGHQPKPAIQSNQPAQSTQSAHMIQCPHCPKKVFASGLPNHIRWRHRGIGNVDVLNLVGIKKGSASISPVDIAAYKESFKEGFKAAMEVMRDGREGTGQIAA